MSARLRPNPTAVALPVPFNDLSPQWRQIEAGVRRDFDAVFAASAFSQGPQVEAFEQEAAAYLGAGHAIAVSSGTAALHLAMLAAGIGPGDEVLVPAHTFIASIWAVLYVGATPILCEVDAETGTIDVEDAARRMTPHTRAIVPVHLYGQPADMDAIGVLGRQHGLVIIEDAAQSFGARWRDRATGTLGALGCTSFYPGKTLGAAGDGGMILTADAIAANRLRALRNHAQRDRHVHAELGFNYRMDDLQSVVLRHKLRRLDAWLRERKDLAALYGETLAGLPLTLPRVRHHDHAWHLYVVRTPRRDALRAALEQAGIETGLHYPIPCHRQPALAHLSLDACGFANAERWAEEGLSLPLFVGMTAAQLCLVADAVRDFFRHA